MHPITASIGLGSSPREWRVPIPGTTKIENFNQNIGALSVKLTPEEMDELESFATEDSVKGERYTNSITTWKDSETPPLSSWKDA